MTIFNEITDKRELDELLKELRSSQETLKNCVIVAKDIITRRVSRPEYIRSAQRRLFPLFQQMLVEVRELIAEAKEQRSNVQHN